MALPRIEQSFGRYSHVLIMAEGDDCKIRTGGDEASFQFSEITRVMVSEHSGFFVPDGSRIIHLLGPEGEVARLKVRRHPADAQAAATFIRHLLQEWKRSN
jgi:hypothetical protein